MRENRFMDFVAREKDMQFLHENSVEIKLKIYNNAAN